MFLGLNLWIIRIQDALRHGYTQCAAHICSSLWFLSPIVFFFLTTLSLKWMFSYVLHEQPFLEPWSWEIGREFFLLFCGVFFNLEYLPRSQILNYIFSFFLFHMWCSLLLLVIHLYGVCLGVLNQNHSIKCLNLLLVKVSFQVRQWSHLEEYTEGEAW